MPRTVRRRTAPNGGISANTTRANTTRANTTRANTIRANTIITGVVLLIAAAIIGGALLTQAAEAAGAQGKYREMYRALYDNYRQWAPEPGGEQAGVESTPTLFVNVEKFQPRGNSYADVDRQLRALLDRELGA